MGLKNLCRAGGLRLRCVHRAGADLVDAARAMAVHRLLPIVDKTFALQDAASAYGYVNQGAKFGKVVIQIP